MTNYFPILILSSWLLGLLFFYWPGKAGIKKRIGEGLIIAGIIVIIFQIIQMWILLERPPLRTLGETRLWYSLFLPVIGLILWFRWKLRWMPGFSLFLAAIFIIINLIHPENFEKALMPALKSPWFMPHVLVYIFAYSLLAAATLLALKGLYNLYRNKFEQAVLDAADNIVYLGLSFLTLGLLFGALWAKEAWGHYWTWDPKETWAFITWMFYLLFIHFRFRHKNKVSISLIILSVAFVVLLICWFGINYLPSAANSVHVYSN
jgi:ABC-type transport system involved in cytochrome c biogenesis permease subunit